MVNRSGFLGIRLPPVWRNHRIPKRRKVKVKGHEGFVINPFMLLEEAIEVGAALEKIKRRI